jgi:flagellar hook-associated protein 2
MSSISSPISSLDSSSASTYFNGMSSYSQSLNNEISQEVQLASLPIQILENDVSTLDSQQSELQTLSADMQSVQSAVEGIGSAVSSMLTGTVSDPSVATATVSSDATAGTYTLSDISLGSYTDVLSVAGSPAAITEPTSQNIGSGDSFTLTVGAGPGVAVSGGNLNALANSINQAGAGVQATVVNVGSNQSPDYRLALQSDQLGTVSIALTDSQSDNLLGTPTTGAPTTYTIDGQTVSTSSDSVTLAPGLTVNLIGNTAGSTTITVAPNSANVGNALESFVNAYNSAMTDLGKNIGQSGGALAGQSVVYELSDALQSLANYSSGSGVITSMAALGLTFNDTSGTLSFDQSTFDSATSGQTAALQQFLGSATGGGFLETAANTMSSLVDPTTGILTNDINSVQSSITNTNSQITDEQNQVSQLQTNLTNQMSAADAMIYSMQQQATYFQQMFAAEQANETGGLA